MPDASMYILNPVLKEQSFDEMVKPLTLYATAYKEQEAKIEDMTDKAAALEWIANQNPDSKTAALYRDMSDKIKGIRDDLMINGLQGGTRSRILGTRRMYSANSAEITRRYEDMKAYRDRMDKLKDTDSSIVFSPESQNISIDDFAGGNRPQIRAISGNEIMARGAAVGKRLTSQIFGDGIEGQVMGGQFWKTYKEQGMTDEALFNALNQIGQSDKYKMAKQVIDGVYSSFADFDDRSQNYLKNRFIEGVYSGATYARDVDYQQNEDHINPIEKENILASQTQRAIAWNQDKRNAEEHEVSMRAAGYEKKDGKWVLSAGATPSKYGGSGSSSSSGSGGSGSSSSAGRVGERKAVYMKAGDDGSSNAGFVNQIPVNEKGERVDQGKDLNIKYENDKLNMYVTESRGEVLIATYNPKTKQLEKSFAKGNDDVLRQLGKEITYAANNTPGSYDAVADNYNIRFKPNTNVVRSSNASMYFGPAIDRVYPNVSDNMYSDLSAQEESAGLGDYSNP